MLKHQVQTHQAVLRVVEARGSRPDDVDAEGLPEVHGGLVGLDHRVELDALEASRPCPVEVVPPESSSNPATLVLAVTDALTSGESRDGVRLGVRGEVGVDHQVSLLRTGDR
jgi:hypothetical protein